VTEGVRDKCGQCNNVSEAKQLLDQIDGIDNTIADLRDQLIETHDADRIASLQVEIAEYEKRRAIVEEALSKIQRFHDYCDEQYFQYVANINPNASTIERVAQYLAIDIQELSKNRQKFLEVMRHTRLMQLAQQTTENVPQNREIIAQIKRVRERIEKLARESEHRNERVSRYYQEHIDTLRAELAESRQQLREERSRNDDMLVRLEQELAKRGERIARDEAETGSTIVGRSSDNDDL
jgi:predicted  nucleic acid-binding Zn-ribbon protein